MGDTHVRDIMSDNIVAIRADDTLSTVEDIMTLGHVRHMPVVSRGKLVGVVSERDLLRVSLSKKIHRRADGRPSFPERCHERARRWIFFVSPAQLPSHTLL